MYSDDTINGMTYEEYYRASVNEGLIESGYILINKQSKYIHPISFKFMNKYYSSNHKRVDKYSYKNEYWIKHTQQSDLYKIYMILTNKVHRII
jgi:hypothetical protein